jgi:carbonic anhydrase/acetyltransferase-like protein (isoleucine patch superfamily)
MPKIAANVYIAPNAAVIGAVEIGEEVGIWFNVTIRGDVEPIKIGARTNIQDNTAIHCTRGGHPTTIGEGVTVGHGVILHACTLKDNCFVGMGAIVMDDCVIESNAMLAAGAMLTPNKTIPSGQLWAGSPAKYFRDLTEEEIAYFPISAANYVKHVHEYLQEPK